MKILILGGYGVFGGRLAELLSDLSDLELLICGRNVDAAEAFCARHSGKARVLPVRLDRSNIDVGLSRLNPDLVVDASGPFQDYGDNRYGVISACIAAGIDYLDFADSADFVFGVSQFDDAAKSADIFVLSGVSSFPVLTAAVVRELARNMEIRSVDGGIAPSPFAGIGLNVMRAVVSYAGAPVRLRRKGVDARGTGLAESRQYTIAVPGLLPLRSKRFSLVDVPDLRVIPPEYPTMTDIWMGAGPVPEILHRALNLLASARARLRLPSWEPFSRLFYVVLNMMRFGEHRGGMYVRAQGLCDGVPVERSWHLLAEGDDGPYIPSMAIEAIVRRLFAGIRPASGARPANHALELSDYDKLFEGRSIFTGFRNDDLEGMLYPKLLASAFERLPPRVRELHAGSGERRWNGTARVRRGKSLLAKLVCALLQFPGAGDNVPVSVTFLKGRDKELWTRDFGGKTFSSEQVCGEGRDQSLLVERFGVVAVSLALVIDGNRLQLVPRRWSLLGVPLPTMFLPDGKVFETEEDGRFRFDVEIRTPITGLIVAYAGHLVPAA